MANRVANGDRIYNEPWNRLTREVFYWLLFSGADSLGMQAERPGVVATVLSENDSDDPITTAQAQEAIDILCSGPRPALIRYSADGRSYLIFRKWQEWQRIYFCVDPACPMPEPETLTLLSEGTRGLFDRNTKELRKRMADRLQKRLDRKDKATHQELASNSPVSPVELAPTGTGTVSGTASVSEKKKRPLRRAKPVADECPYCKWRKDNPEKRPPTPGKDEYSPKWRGQCYHDSACDTLGVECFTVTGKEGNLLRAAITKHGERTVWKWWLQFLKEKVDIGHSIAVFASNASLVKFSEEKASG